MRTLAKAPTLLAVLLLLASCSHQKTIDADELRSDLTAAISLASEAETFIDYVAQHRSTGNYAKGHIQYLAEEAGRTAKELREARPAAPVAQKFPEFQKQLDALSHQLSTFRMEIDREQAALASKEKISKVRAALEQVKAGL